MKQFKKIALLCSLFLATATGCAHKKQASQKTIQLNAGKKPDHKQAIHATKAVPQVTVWVHGTKFDPLLNLLHSVAKPGINKATTLPKHYLIGNTIKNLSKTDPMRFPLEHFYVFGWSGALSFQEREKEAQKLYNELTVLVQNYKKKYKQTPILRLITHSHGGNVVLNLAKIKRNDACLKINQAILLACPVQHETKKLVHDELFETVYSLYSTRDLIQILDPQGLYRTPNNEQRHFELSNRLFPHGAKVRQAELKIDGHGIGHAGFVMSYFTSVLPAVISEMETWHSTEHENNMVLVSTK